MNKVFKVNRQIYLDYNATVPVLEKVKNSLIECLDFGPLNASSVHYYGRKGKNLVQNAKLNISRLINTDSENIIFTSSATEAINLLFNNFNTIVVSSIEHLAVLSSSKSELIIPVDKNGVVDLNNMESLLADISKNKKEILVSVMWVNNETGVIQPIRDVIEIAKKYGCLVHCDAAQALGKIEINLNELEIDFLTLSGHKIGAPTGIGALINNSKFSLAPQILGGGQEKGIRAGTENILGILGFGEAARIMSGMPRKNDKKVKYLRDYLIKKIRETRPETIFFGQKSNTVSNTLLMALPNIYTWRFSIDEIRSCIIFGKFRFSL